MVALFGKLFELLALATTSGPAQFEEGTEQQMKAVENALERISDGASAHACGHGEMVLEVGLEAVVESCTEEAHKTNIQEWIQQSVE